MGIETQENVPAAALRRCLAMLTAAQRELAELVVPVDGGTALLTPSLPLVWDANVLHLINRVPVGAGDLVRTAARLTAEHGLARATVTTDDQVRARSLSPGFAALGWGHEQHLVMVATGSADRPPHRWAPVVETSSTEVEGARREWLEGEPWATPAVVEQILEFDRRLGSHLGGRCLAVHLDRRVVSHCRLYQSADVAQIEDLATAPLHRNKGYARALIAAARDAARAAGARDVFLVADAAGWPRALYARLGFSPGRVVHRFRPRPD